MKLTATILLLAIGVTCISAQYVTTWGDVHNFRLLAEQRVQVTSGWLQVRERTVTFRSNGPTVIRGIMHMDLNSQASRVTPTISDGGVGQRLAAVRIVSRRSHGINSTVRFYG